MPTIAVKASVLDGRAEVVAYTRDSSKYFLRVRVPDKAGYKSRRIDGVDTLDAAVNAALGVFCAASNEPDSRHTPFLYELSRFFLAPRCLLPR